MFETYPNIEYDEKTRRINRRIKFAFVPLVVLIVAGVAYGISQIDFTTGLLVVNDTQGSMVCVHVTESSAIGDSKGLHYAFSGAIEPGEQKRIARSSACSVFTAAGDYQGCLFVTSDSSKDQRIKASGAQTRVKAGACVYPR
jgi:hypothetical protein